MENRFSFSRSLHFNVQNRIIKKKKKNRITSSVFIKYVGIWLKVLIAHSFLCLDNITLYVLYMLMDMGCLYFLALVVSIGHQCSCISEYKLSISVSISSCISVLILLDIYLGVEMLSHMVILWLTFEDSPNCFMQLLCHLHSHQRCRRVPVSLLPCRYLLFSSLNYIHSSGCEVVAHCAFDLRFPSDR